MNGSCNDCSYCKFPGYLYCSKHGCRVDGNDCCPDYKDPLDTLVEIFIKEEKRKQQAQTPQPPREVKEANRPQAPVPEEKGPDITPMLRYLGIGLGILGILALFCLVVPFL